MLQVIIHRINPFRKNEQQNIMKKILLFCFVMALSTKSSQAQTEITFYTSMGDFVVETYDTLQPITSGNFIDLVNTEFYDGILFHRVISSFMIQGGDPSGTGNGGPGYSIEDEFNPGTSNIKKTISMANSGPNTGGSQFFINLVNNTYLNSNHPVFGIVTTDFSVVQSIGGVSTDSNDKPLTDVIMDSVRVTLVNPYIGIGEFEQPLLSISVSPNPVNDYISISLNNNITDNDYLLTISNLLGQAVHSEYLTQQKTTVDVSYIVQKGMYFVNVLDEKTNTKIVQKIVLR